MRQLPLTLPPNLVFGLTAIIVGCNWEAAPDRGFQAAMATLEKPATVTAPSETELNSPNDDGYVFSEGPGNKEAEGLIVRPTVAYSGV